VVGSEWAEISSNYDVVVARKSDGPIWNWGRYTYGQLATDDFIDRNAPVQVGTGSDWSRVFAGNNQGYAIRNDGTLWTWGDNTEGELANGTLDHVYQPAQIGTDNDWATIVPGGHHILALKNDGTLWGWGMGGFGALGNGSADTLLLPEQVATGTWAGVAAGLVHSIALRTDGTLWAAGDPTAIVPATPVPFWTQVGTDDDWASVGAGAISSMAVKADGTLWLWGQTLFGTALEPTQVGTDTDWASASGGLLHHLAAKTDGTLWAWGANSNGQLGDGSNTARALPGPVPCDGIPTHVDQLAELPLRVYPDATGEWLVVEGHAALEHLPVRVLDQAGRLVLEQRMAHGRVAIAALGAGAYVVQVAVVGGWKSGRFVKW
ncbi:MAG: hypothetical protein RBT71_10080, partial [Flavobacteriales bacterium]|nr:hypothetical protein [Flavobacteriales bacterium]